MQTNQIDQGLTKHIASKHSRKTSSTTPERLGMLMITHNLHLIHARKRTQSPLNY